jgi:hypothetical protein
MVGERGFEPPTPWSRTWEGTVLLPKQGARKVRLELREHHDKQGQFLGYSNLSCTPNMLEIMRSSSRDTR